MPAERRLRQAREEEIDLAEELGVPVKCIQQSLEERKKEQEAEQERMEQNSDGSYEAEDRDIVETMVRNQDIMEKIWMLHEREYYIQEAMKKLLVDREPWVVKEERKNRESEKKRLTELAEVREEENRMLRLEVQEAEKQKEMEQELLKKHYLKEQEMTKRLVESEERAEKAEEELRRLCEGLKEEAIRKQEEEEEAEERSAMIKFIVAAVLLVVGNFFMWYFFSDGMHV